MPGTPDLLSLLCRDAERGKGGKTLPRARGTATIRRARYPRRAPALAYPCPDAPLSRRAPVLNGSLSRRAPVLTGLCPGVLLLRGAYLPQRLLFRCASVSTCSWLGISLLRRAPCLGADLPPARPGLGVPLLRRASILVDLCTEAVSVLARFCPGMPLTSTRPLPWCTPVLEHFLPRSAPAKKGTAARG